MAQDNKTLVDYLNVLKRRKTYIVTTWLLISVVSVIAAYNLPKTFRSTATMLIEAPLPTKLFESTISQYADEQIQSIYQRIITTDNVLSIIESNGLYSDVKDGYTRHELAELFRKNAEVGLATSSLTPKTSSGVAEIAFNISFSDNDPVKAKETASNLVSLFIQQNDKSRTQRATKSADFLMEESDKLNRELQNIDGRIAKFKEQNNFSLPEQTQGNLAAIDRAENELRDTESQARATKERIVFLAAELARAQQEVPGKLDDKTPQTKEDALRALKAQYLRFSSIYSPSHPSVVRLKREIDALEPGFDGQPAQNDIVLQLDEARQELKQQEKTYSNTHPVVAGLKKQIFSLEQQLNNKSSRSDSGRVAFERTTNPAYLGVEAQYKTSQSELQSLLLKQDYLKAKLENMHKILVVAPQVEKGYNDLIRERDNTAKKYNQLKEKWLDAKLLQTQEEQQQGQTLSVIEQPVVPAHPEKAIRRKVAIGGFFLGIMAGVGLAFIAEFLDPGLIGYRAIAETTGLMPIVVIPYIENPVEEINKHSKQRTDKLIIVLTFVVGSLIAAAAMFYFFHQS